MQTNTLLAGLVLSFAAMSALAQAPPLDTMTGARPGHEPGIGESLPRSDNASNILSGNGRSGIAPTLPKAAIGEDGASRDFLVAARVALVAGRTGQAQQSLEMAETRSLDRSVPQGQTGVASDSTLVGRIRDARHALGKGKHAEAIALIDLALAGRG